MSIHVLFGMFVTGFAGALTIALLVERISKQFGNLVLCIAFCAAMALALIGLSLAVYNSFYGPKCVVR